MPTFPAWCSWVLCLQDLGEIPREDCYDENNSCRMWAKEGQVRRRHPAAPPTQPPLCQLRAGGDGGCGHPPIPNGPDGLHHFKPSAPLMHPAVH